MYSPGSMAYWFARCPINYVGKVKSFKRIVFIDEPIVEQNCSYDEQPFASERSLHAIHYLIFLIGTSRIIAIISLVFASHKRLAQWSENLKRIKVRHRHVHAYTLTRSQSVNQRKREQMETCDIRT